MIWEYYVHQCKHTGFFTGVRADDPQRLMHDLNHFGRYGWELVNAFDTNRYEGATDSVVLVFKRPVMDQPLEGDPSLG